LIAVTNADGGLYIGGNANDISRLLAAAAADVPSNCVANRFATAASVTQVRMYKHYF